MENIISFNEIYEAKANYKAKIQLDKIMKKLFTLSNKKPILDFLNAIYKDNLSDMSVVEYLNKEVTTNNIIEKNIFDSLYSDLRLQVIDVERVFNYSIEFQTKEDKSIAIRLFRYSFELEVQNIGKNKNEMTIYLPKPYVIVLEQSKDVPDYYILNLILGDSELKYNCPVLKYWQYDLERLYKNNMYILLPVKLIEIRKQIQRIQRKKIKIELGNPLIHKIHDDIIKLTGEVLIYIKRVYDEGFIDIAEFNEFNVIMENLISYMNKELNEVFSEIEEEVEQMVKTFYDPEVEKRGIEKGIEKGKLEIAKNLLNMNMSIEDIINATGLTAEEVLKLKDN